MKKITLLILMLFLSLAGYSQITENFDSGTALPAGWVSVHNSAAPSVPEANKSWRISGSLPGVTPASAPNYAYSQRYSLGQGNTSTNWLITARIPVPLNGQIQFNTRQFASGIQGGTEYQIKVSKTSQDTLTFSNVSVFGEDGIDDGGTNWEQKTIALNTTTYPQGSFIWVAFVRKQTQTTPAPSADTYWMIDDVRVNSKCATPLPSFVPNSTGLTSSIFSWSNPQGATKWEIVIGYEGQTLQEALADPTLFGLIVKDDGIPQLNLATIVPQVVLTPDTNYKYFVRAICSEDNKSEWSDAAFFKTKALGETCADPIVIPRIPFSTNGNTADSADTTDVAQGASCNVTGNYMAGNDRFYTFTAPITGEIRIRMSPTSPNSSIFVYRSCGTVGVTCLAGVGNTNSTTRVIPALQVVAGERYIIVLSSAAATQTYSYYLELQYVSCNEPTNLNATAPTRTTVNLSWDNPFPANQWEYAVQTAGSQIPGGAGVLVGNGTDPAVTSYSVNGVTTDLAGNPIVGSTRYQFWVRSKCDPLAAAMSPWAGPFEFVTPICEPTTGNICDHPFILRGSGGWNGAIMNVVQNGIVVKVLGPQFTSGTSLTIQVPLCTGIPVSLFWVNPGTSPQTVAITVNNSFGQQLYIKNPNNVDVPDPQIPMFTEMVDCLFPKCLPPTNVVSNGAATITANSIGIRWTAAAGTSQWEVDWIVLGEGTAPDNAAVVNPARLTSTAPTTTAPYIATGLRSDTQYVFYVRAVCGNDRKSNWVPLTAASIRTIESCKFPTSPVVLTTQRNAASFSWTQGALSGIPAPTQWEVVVQLAGSATPAYDRAISNPRLLNIGELYTGLNSGTQYEYWVRSYCSDTDVSRWVKSAVFNTLCDPLDVPYSQAFNTTSDRIFCWTVINGGGANPWILNYATTPIEGNGSASFAPNAGTNNDDWLVSPTLNLQANYRMRFKYKVQNATGTASANSIEIKLSTNGGSAVTDFTQTLMPARSFNNTQAQEMIIYLSDYTGPINVGWHVVNGVENRNRIYIDEVVFEPIPACPVPTFPVVVAGSVTSTSATLSWDAGYQETQWQVVVQPQGTGIPAAGVTGLLTSTNQNLLVNRDYLNQPLQPGTPYEYYVRAYCSDTNQSEWVGPVRFKTLLCEEADKCVFTFTMTDTARNGWQSTMSVIQNGEIVATLSGPANGTLTSTQVVRLCPGVQYSVFWNTGSTAANAAQVGLTITNPYNDVVFTKNPGNGYQNTTIYRGMPFCGPISCPYPTNLQVAQTSGSSVQLTWTPGGTETQWQYVLQAAGGPFPGNTPGTTVPQPLANEFGVPSSTPMEFYVRAVCGPDDLSYWVGPIPFTIFNSPGCIGVDIVGVPISAGHEELVCPNDPCLNLEATYYQTKQTLSYEVQSIPYLPPHSFNDPLATKIPVTTDDEWSPVIDLSALADGTGGSKPFNFCFFGTSYNKLLVTDNGAITFSVGGPQGNGGVYPPAAGRNTAGFQLPGRQIPMNPGNITTLPHKSSINGVLQDLYPFESPSDSSINYMVLGTAPCRAFVMSVYKVAHFSCTSDLETSQIVLYEGSNIIDVYVEERSVCSFNGGNAIIGIQNEDASRWAFPPGRNGGQWTATREAWRFMPNGASENIIFEWRENGVPISNNLALNYCLPDGVDSVLLEAVATYPRCGAPNEERISEVKVIRNKLPIEDPKDLKACAGVTTTFDLTENNANILDGVANTGDYQITYYLTLTEAQVGTGGEITSYTTAVTTPIFVRILNTVTTCWETRTFNLVPDAPLPDYTLDTFDSDPTICTGESTTIVVTPINFVVADATYEWSLPDGTILSETSNILTIPAGTAEGVYTYIVKVNDGCETIKSYTLTVTNDDPVVAFHYDTPVCIAATTNPVAIPDGSPLTTGTGIQFKVPAGSPLVFANATTGEIDLTQTPAGVYQITYEVPATPCTALGIDSFEITIDDVAPAITGFRYDNPTVCVNGSVTPTLVTDTGFTTGGTFEFAVAGTTGLTLNSSTGAITIDTNTVPGVYDIVYNVLIDPTSCIAAGTSPVITITVNSGLDADANFTYLDASYCVNSASVTPNFVANAGGEFSATPSGLNINAITGEITIAGSTVGNYRVQYEIRENTATCLKGDIKFFDITIEAEIDVTIADNCENANYVLHATPDDSSYDYTWKNALGTTVGTNSPTFNVTDYVNGISNPVYPMKFTVTVNNGCDTTEEFTVQSIACNIPKGISPNGDGDNDEFDLTGFNVRKLEIFNRYGMKVNSFGNYTKEWRGQSDKGNELPDGTYYYVIERDGVKTVTGWVQINRQRN